MLDSGKLRTKVYSEIDRDLLERAIFISLSLPILLATQKNSTDLSPRCLNAK